MNQVFSLIGLRDLIAAEVLLPTSLYMGVLTTMNQWHRDREAFALYGAGVVPGRAAYPVWLIAIVVCTAVAGMSLFARPWAYAESYNLDADAGQLARWGMQADHFYTFGQNLVLTASSIDHAANLMHGVFVQTRLAEEVRVIRSDAGRIYAADADNRQRVELGAGISYSISESTRADRKSEFEKLGYFAPSEPLTDGQNKRRAAPTQDLLAVSTPKERAELQWRICLPIIAFFMTLIAVEISRSLPGRSPYPRFLAGIAVYAVVFNIA